MKYINRLNGIQLEISVDELCDLENIANRHDNDRGYTSSTDRLSKIAKNIIKIFKTIKK